VSRPTRARSRADRGAAAVELALLTPLLVLFGVGLVIGNLLGGRYADRAQLPTLYISIGVLLVVLVAFSFTSHFKIPAAHSDAARRAGFATVPGFMNRPSR
jgi:DHA1 family inner membrane transport protein